MLLNKMASFVLQKVKTDLVKNSMWGVSANIVQNILYSVFFIVVARKYSTADFGGYVIANTLYSFVVAFSALGLGQWFIRELVSTDDKVVLINRFFKIQLGIGVFFYGINIILSQALYPDNSLIRILSLLIGINVIFDNIIYVITFVNIAQHEQKKTFVIFTIEAFLKFLIACLLFIFPLAIVYLALILILLRLTTLGLFIRIGCSKLVSLSQVLKTKIDLREVKQLIASNWSFIVIGSIAVIYWRIGNILVSKNLSMAAVADYEVSFKLFSMAQIIPVIVSSSLFPMLVKAWNRSSEEAWTLYRRAFIAYTIYGVLAYTFVYSFSDRLIPFLFGNKYLGTPVFCKEMFLTILVFPTALLQANLLISMKLEKIDMRLNIMSLLINVLISVAGLYFTRSLSAVNYAIFFSFLVFHAAQDVWLWRRKITNSNHAILFYVISAAVVLLYRYLADNLTKEFLFPAFWLLVASGAAVVFLRIYREKVKLPA